MFCYLMSAARSGVDFTRLGTIGRQDFKLTRHELPPIVQAFGLSESPDDVMARGRENVDRVYEMCGAQEVEAIDASDYEGATIVHDLNEPIGPKLKRRFTTLVDIGSIEHIFNFPQVIRNYMEMVAEGGHLIIATCGNNLLGHGFYQFSPELFYRVLSSQNGYEVLGLHLCLPYFYPPRFYVVPDPAAIRNRVELTNDEPVDIMVLARRTRICDVLEEPVQQSDYSMAWQGRSREALPPARPSASRRLKAWARRMLGEGTKVAIKRTFGLSYAPYHGFGQSCFQRVTLEELAAGGVVSRSESDRSGQRPDVKDDMPQTDESEPLAADR